ncbi:succinyl-diaminopimelate desuccinylase [Mycobacterium frederiksbergense]|uniref:Succinyl-diaminopimelate desuccinylase n=1 Tax=Mycolicibacterium frederiksbergense TaxID=117567 RepID=A0ABT6KXS2_9MYCO|nr:M20 family metallopeptidase [Mycolicibacterium frederiksbergense]MDH6195517.1 succinyl-diaminopimelate desuccinylase [Mycolicibacterium frederiksbergense]
MIDRQRETAALAAIDVVQIVTDTCDLIRGRGENPGDTEQDTVLRLKAICERIGATVTLQDVAPGRPNLRAGIGPEDAPAVLFLGHSDVVPVGAGWTGDPFEPRIHDGLITGRGASDMRGGIAAVIAAMSAVAAVAPDVRLELLCTVDEEDRATGVHSALAFDPPRPYLACIVAEPTNLDVVIGCRGATNFIVELTGASAHAGRPEDGASSIYAANELMTLVRQHNDAALRAGRDPLLGGPSWNVGTIDGGSGTSMVPRRTTVTIDRRTMPGEDPTAILDHLLAETKTAIESSGIANADQISLRGEVDMQMPGFHTDPGAPIASVASDALRELGTTGTLTGWTAACEGGFIAQRYGTPTIILGPGDINTQAHQPDENVSIDQLTTAARVYALIALRLNESHTGTSPYPITVDHELRPAR